MQQCLQDKKSRIRKTLNILMCADSRTDTKNKNEQKFACVMCHVLPVTWHLVPVTCHLTTTLWSCYESTRMLGDAVKGGLVIDRERKIKRKSEKINFFL